MVSRRRRTSYYQRLAWRVQDILVGCGLSQRGASIVGGVTIDVPTVVSVDPGPPVTLDVRILPGQMPDHYAKHAQTIAYNLGVAKVEVEPLGPYLIRLTLLPRP